MLLPGGGPSRSPLRDLPPPAPRLHARYSRTYAGTTMPVRLAAYSASATERAMRVGVLRCTKWD
eukprot:2883376-Rhodomonas_salina.1